MPMNKCVTLLMLCIALFALPSCSDSDVSELPDSNGEPGDKLEIVDGKARFYLSTDETAPHVAMGLEAHKWIRGEKIRVNNKSCAVQMDEQKRPYIEVAEAEDAVYQACYYKTGKFIETSCFTGVIMPLAYYYGAALQSMIEFPLYAVYTPETGNRLVFRDAYAALAVTLKGDVAIASIKAEDLAGEGMSGVAEFSKETKALTLSDSSASFVTLNCSDAGDGVQLSSAGVTFYVVVPARNYPSGLRLTICDRNHRAMFYDISAVNLAANANYSVNIDYAPAENQLFYEGFDTFVWGGNIMAGEDSVAYSPSDEVLDIDGGQELQGTEDALSAVSCDAPGSGYMQPNTWDTKGVAQNHQMSEAYLKSRNIYDWKYLFRCQEYQGCIAIGVARTVRGILQTCPLSNLTNLSTVDISFNFCFQAGVTDDLLFEVTNGGFITSCKVDGQAVAISTDNYSVKSNAAMLTVFRSQVDIPTSNVEPKTWHKVEITAENVSDGSALYWTSSTTSSGVHGIYVDDIQVTKVREATVGANNLRVLYWNIQNGMWADQGNNYDNFVKWVKRYNPDICVWCEAQSIYKTGTNVSMAAADRYLPDGWSALAARYGHGYVAKSAHHDNYPQVITSKYPITTLASITGSSDDVVVSHGAGLFRINANGQSVNVVTLHLWPQSYAYGASNQSASTAENGGDLYREREIAYICSQTVNQESYASDANWLMLGDFNSRAICDNWIYNYAESDTRFLVHKYISANTSLMDIIGNRYKGYFITSTAGSSRIDYIYTSAAMYNRISNAVSVSDSFATLEQDAAISNFYHPSDHRPILVDFEMK